MFQHSNRSRPTGFFDQSTGYFGYPGNEEVDDDIEAMKSYYATGGSSSDGWHIPPPEQDRYGDGCTHSFPIQGGFEPERHHHQLHHCSFDSDNRFYQNRDSVAMDTASGEKPNYLYNPTYAPLIDGISESEYFSENCSGYGNTTTGSGTPVVGFEALGGTARERMTSQVHEKLKSAPEVYPWMTETKEKTRMRPPPQPKTYLGRSRDSTNIHPSLTLSPSIRCYFSSKKPAVPVLYLR